MRFVLWACTLAVFAASVVTTDLQAAGAKPNERCYSRMSVDVSGLPAEKAFLRDLVLSRVAVRTPPSNAADVLTVKFAIDTSIVGENAVVSVRGDCAEIRGGRFRALVFGAGRLLRAIRYGTRTFALEDGDYPFSPAKPFRQAYLARHFDNWYLKASADELMRYAEDLALWGINAFHVHLDYPMVDAAKATAGDRAVFAAISTAFGERIRALDLDLTTIGGENAAPLGMPAEFRAVPNKPRRGADEFNVCPEKPGALDYLLGIRRAAIERAKGIPVNGYVYWPFDEGGCGCNRCSPWGGVGFPKLMERMHRLNDAATPGAKHIVSAWYFDDRDWPGFYDFLARQDWVDYVLIDAHEDFPQYPLEHPLPKNVPVITFPEISMWGRFPWGGTGANPLPRRFERLFRQAERLAKGFQLYSEGIYEDVNKVVINGLYVSPSKSAGDVLTEYAAWELPGADSADFIHLAGMLEDIYCTSATGKGGWRNSAFSNYVCDADASELDRRAAVAAEAAALAERIDRSILPRMRRAWRWRQIYLRAKIDAAVYAARDIRTSAALPMYAELVALYHAERQAAGLVGGTWPGYTCPPVADCRTVVERRRNAAAFGPEPQGEGRFRKIVAEASYLTSPNEHVQGVCVSPRAIYLSYERRLVKLDWKGRELLRIDTPAHTGDLCFWNGRVFVSVADREDRRGKGRIWVYDENLGLLRDVPTGKTMDGICCLDGVLHVGNGVKAYKGMKSPKDPHRVNLIARYDAETLEPLGQMEDLDYGHETRYGTQNIATDGERIFAVFYGAKGADNIAVFSRDYRTVRSLRLDSCKANGLEHVRGDLFMFCETKNRVGTETPSTVELTFWRWTGTTFVDVTSRQGDGGSSSDKER